MAKRKRVLQAVNNLVIVSDMHMICRLGLCPPEGIPLDDGGVYLPSPLQLKVWDMWQYFWHVWVPMVTRGEPFAIVVNGDAIDGTMHHGNVTHISGNPVDMKRLAMTVLEPLVKMCDGRYYHIRGTEAHVGQSGCDEEELAESLGAIPDADGRYARWELWARLGGRALCHIMHHIGTAGSLAYETTAVQKELEQAFVEAARWGDEPPDVICRSHRHRNIETRVPGKKGYAISFTTAGWQLKTPFAHRIAGARQTQPQIGGSVIRVGDEDVYTRHQLWELERTPEVVI